jgi:hypothetical protein
MEKRIRRSDMWRMSNQGKVLEGSIKKLFREGVRYCRDYAEFESGDYSGQYRSMEYEERVAALWYVWQALTNDKPAPEPKAWMEATIFTVFQCVGGQAMMEEDWKKDHHDCNESLGIEPGDEDWEDYESYWMPLIDAACDEMEDPSTGDWEDKAEGLADTILWDRDWVMDNDAGANDPVWQALRIDSDYFECQNNDDLFEKADAMFVKWIEDEREHHVA